jgi:hypothetical protein
MQRSGQRRSFQERPDQRWISATIGECVAGEALYRLGRPARLSGIVPMSEQSGCLAPWK